MYFVCAGKHRETDVGLFHKSAQTTSPQRDKLRHASLANGSRHRLNTNTAVRGNPDRFSFFFFRSTLSVLLDAPIGDTHGGEEQRVLADEGGVDRAVYEVGVLEHVQEEGLHRRGFRCGVQRRRKKSKWHGSARVRKYKKKTQVTNGAETEGWSTENLKHLGSSRQAPKRLKNLCTCPSLPWHNSPC